MNAFFARFKSNFDTPKINRFFSKISKNENCNISIKIEIHDTRQVVLLSYNHRGSRY